MKVTLVKIKISGLYEWGRGWSSYTKSVWDEYFHSGMLNEDGNRPIFWHFVEEEGAFSNSQYLVGVCGGAMIHPMECTMLIRHIGDNPCDAEVEELEGIFSRIAERLGGSVELKKETYSI